MPIPKRDWWDKVFAVEHQAFQPNFAQPSLSRMCLQECRYCISGAMTIIGFRISACPGTALYTKQQWLKTASYEELMTVTNDSSCVSIKEHQLALMPSGFVLYMVTDTGYVGLRWAVSGDRSDTARGLLRIRRGRH